MAEQTWENFLDENIEFLSEWFEINHPEIYEEWEDPTITREEQIQDVETYASEFMPEFIGERNLTELIEKYNVLSDIPHDFIETWIENNEPGLFIEWESDEIPESEMINEIESFSNRIRDDFNLVMKLNQIPEFVNEYLLENEPSLVNGFENGSISQNEYEAELIDLAPKILEDHDNTSAILAKIKEDDEGDLADLDMTGTMQPYEETEELMQPESIIGTPYDLGTPAQQIAAIQPSGPLTKNKIKTLFEHPETADPRILEQTLNEMSENQALRYLPGLGAYGVTLYNRFKNPRKRKAERKYDREKPQRRIKRGVTKTEKPKKPAPSKVQLAIEPLVQPPVKNRKNPPATDLSKIPEEPSLEELTAFIAESRRPIILDKPKPKPKPKITRR